VKEINNWKAKYYYWMIKINKSKMPNNNQKRAETNYYSNCQNWKKIIWK